MATVIVMMATAMMLLMGSHGRGAQGSPRYGYLALVSGMSGA